MLLGIHWMLGRLLEAPEFDLDEEESAKLAKAIARVTDLYDHKMNPAILAWGNLAIVSGGIYGPRAVAYMARKRKAERSKVVDLKIASTTERRETVASMQAREPEPGTFTNPSHLYGDGRGADLTESASA
jgi:hypothetical protein